MNAIQSATRIAAAVGLAAVLAGCATGEPIGQLLDRNGVVALNSVPAAATYRLAPGDRIDVKFYFNKELNDEVTVRPDGRISLQLVGEVAAAGLTPEDLGKALTAAYTKAFGTDPNDYVLGIGERLSIKSFYHDKLNEDVVIRPDGKVSMQLAGEIQAAGRTPGQLSSDIAGRLAKFLEAPDVSIIVREFRRPELSVGVRESAAQRVFVGGEVKQAGVLPLQGRLGLAAATFQAGGLLESARTDNVILLRHTGDQEPAVYGVNLGDILRGELPDVALRPLDVVYVPKSAGAEVAAVLRQNIYSLLPTQFLFSVGYQINPRVEVKNQ